MDRTDGSDDPAPMVLHPRAPLVLFAALLACGPATPSSSSEATSTTSTTTGTTAAPTTSDATSTSTTGLGSTTSSLETTADTSLAQTTSSTGAPPSEPYYYAYYYGGGYNRLIIRKADPIADRCTAIQFVFDKSQNLPPELIQISTPENWTVERIFIESGLASCAGHSLLPSEIDATAAVGSVSWEGFNPQLIDFDLTLSFAQDEPWKPAQEHFLALDFPVD